MHLLYLTLMGLLEGENVLPLVLGLAMGAVLASVGSLVMVWRTKRKLDHLLTLSHHYSRDPAQLLPALIDRSATLEGRLAKLEEQSRNTSHTLQQAIQRVGLVHYNPFRDDGVGGNPSFSLALFNGSGTGVILTAIHGRDRTRLYAKTLHGTTSSLPLSKEEEEAMRRALHTDAPEQPEQQAAPPVAKRRKKA